MARCMWKRLLLVLLYYGTWRCEASAVRKGGNTRSEESINKDFVRFIQPPSKLSSQLHLNIEYGCSEPSVVGYEVRVYSDAREDFPIVLHTWRCDPNESPGQKIRNLKLPPNFGYRPDHFNQYSAELRSCILRGWVLDRTKYVHERRRQGTSFYHLSSNKAKHWLKVVPPYERPPKPADSCISWWLAYKTSRPYSPQCSAEPEIYSPITFPVALSGKPYGVMRYVPSYRNKVLSKVQSTSIQPPRLKFTLSVWLYVNEYCPNPDYHLCSIVQRLTWDDRLMTPLIYITKQGLIHFQMTMVGQQGSTAQAYILDEPLPKNQWLRLVVNFHRDKFNLTLNSIENRNPVWVKNIDISGVPGKLWYNDTQELTIFGGSEIHHSFKGYIGEATMYRRQLVPPDKIPYPDPYHAMFELGLSQWENKCRNYLTWIRSRITNYQRLLQYLIAKKSCRNEQRDFFKLSKPMNYSKACPTFSGPRPKMYKFVHSIVRRMVLDGRLFDLSTLGEAMFENATSILEDQGLVAVPRLLSPLKQASCYGNHDATYMLSVLLSQGVTLKANEMQAHSYLMYGAQDGHRLCLLALGNKHVHGLDGVPKDIEQAYVYYKAVADHTKTDREQHKETDVFTEHIRLTDDAAVDRFTEENGDLFQWFKHQAAQGVISAQKDIARMMFWGSGGIKRDLQAAVEQYRIAAEAGDTVAQYDYGIVLMRGQGTEKNVSRGLMYLERAAAKGSHQALGALGWHALEVEHNYTKAAAYLERSHSLGNPDASHNLGSMIMMGRHPNYTTGDKVKAFEYFAIAAGRGQLDSGIMVALYNLRGHPLAPRDPALGVEWARWVAEQNPAVGKILAKGLKAYKNENWPAALIYYMMAADTGLEVATFNLAYLCEENREGLSAYLQKECVYRYYNLSTHRPTRFVDPYSYIKMGDYYWYGCERERNPLKAAEMYSLAAHRGEPHAMFNLAYLVEEGIYIPDAILRRAHVPKSALVNNITLLTALYTRCMAYTNSDAYLPCYIALWRIELLQMWTQYGILVKLSTVAGILVAVCVTATSVYAYLRGNHITINTV